MFGIGELSRLTGCPIETIRYYEKLGLLKEPERTGGGHRLYNKKHQDRLVFILKSRDLGFSLEKTGSLLSLSENAERSCSDALLLVEENLRAVNEKIQALQRIQAVLMAMENSCQSCCPGAKAPECTIVEALSNTNLSDDIAHA